MGFNKAGCCFFFICTTAIVLYNFFFFWLSVTTANESLVKCSIQGLIIPSMINNGRHYLLNTSNTIFFNLKLSQESTDMGVYYDDLVFTFSYVGNPGSVIQVAKHTLTGFHDKGSKEGSTTYISDYATTSVVNVSTNASSSVVVIRVDLATRVRFKYTFWKGKRHGFVARGDVEVNGATGKMVNSKGVKLKRVVSHHHSQAVYRAVFAICILFYAVLSLVCLISIFTTRSDN